MRVFDITQPVIYSTQLQRYVWREREKYALLGFFCGGLTASVVWLIAIMF